MPTFIPARGRTLHVAGVWINRIGKLHSILRTPGFSLLIGAGGLKATPPARDKSNALTTSST